MEESNEIVEEITREMITGNNQQKIKKTNERFEAIRRGRFEEKFEIANKSTERSKFNIKRFEKKKKIENTKMEQITNERIEMKTTGKN